MSATIYDIVILSALTIEKYSSASNDKTYQPNRQTWTNEKTWVKSTIFAIFGKQSPNTAHKFDRQIIISEKLISFLTLNNIKFV